MPRHTFTTSVTSIINEHSAYTVQQSKLVQAQYLNVLRLFSLVHLRKTKLSEKTDDLSLSPITYIKVRVLGLFRNVKV